MKARGRKEIERTADGSTASCEVECDDEKSEGEKVVKYLEMTSLLQS